jgi:hypothetical protein
VALGFWLSTALVEPPSTILPQFERLSRRNGTILSGRFVPGTETLVYSAAWDGGPLEIYSDTLEGQSPVQLSFPGAELLSISPTRELALLLDRRVTHGFESSGTLAVASQSSAPRPLLENVLAADWSPDGEELCVVHEVAGTVRLEYPIGSVLYESPGWISRPRVHPDGDRIAFIDHPKRGDNVGFIRIIDLAGKLENLGRGGSWGLAWSPSGQELWEVGGSTLRAVRPGRESKPLYSSPTGLHLLDVEHDGRVLLASATVQREMMVRTKESEQNRNLGWLDWSVPRDISADGSTVLFEEGNTGNRDGYGMYIRDTSGSPPVQIGYGVPIALSPDREWVLTVQGYFTPTQKLVLVPTGPGQSQVLATGDLLLGQQGAWLPDPVSGPDAAIVFAAREGEGPLRLYRLSLAPGASPEPITPAGMPLSEWGVAISPDGSRVTAVPAGQPAMAFPLDGSAPVPLPGIEPGDRPLRFHRDGGHRFVLAGIDVPARIMRIDLDSGERMPWQELAPLDAAGVASIDRLSLSADGETFAFAYKRMTAALTLASDLQ